MAIEITGRLMRVLNMRSGIGKNGEWKNQDFIVEIPGQFPRQICISLWGDKVEILKNFSIGDQLKASVDIESREFNDKWYTSVKAWQIEKLSNNMSSPYGVGNTLPDVPPLGLNDIPPAEEEMDDLPF